MKDPTPAESDSVNGSSFCRGSFSLGNSSDIGKFRQISDSERKTFDLPILAYHKVADVAEPCDSAWVTLRLFIQQMVALHAYGYTTVSFRDIVHFKKRGIALPPRSIILTFDDGYECVYSIVRPILNRYGFKAICFLSTDYIGTEHRCDNSWDVGESGWPTTMMLWKEAAIMQAEGHSCEAHTKSHPRLNSRHPLQALREIAGAKKEIERELGGSVTCFAYPFGDSVDSIILRFLVMLCGYQAAVSYNTGMANLATSDIMALPRIKITQEHSVDLDPAHPDGFFMRAIDPSFPLPCISIGHIEIADAKGNCSRAVFAPGESLSIKVYAINSGSAVNVAASLKVIGNAGTNTFTVFDSHQQSDVYKKPFTCDAPQAFTYIFRIPEAAPAGEYQLRFSVHDEWYVLRYFLRAGGAGSLLKIHSV